jgi:hypothetical protein
MMHRPKAVDNNQQQTVWSLVNRIIDREQPHLDQIETLLK